MVYQQNLHGDSLDIVTQDHTEIELLFQDSPRKKSGQYLGFFVSTSFVALWCYIVQRFLHIYCDKD